jgi:hypothetical protein
MGKIKKYQPGGKVMRKTTKGPLDLSEAEKSIIRRQTRMPQNLNPINRLKKDTVPVDLSAPGKGMMEELKKKGSMPASKKNVGRKGIKVKAKDGKSLKPVDSSKNPGLAKLPTPVRNKMGYQKNGGKMKAKGGAALKKQAATAIAMKKAGKSPKKMMMGGKCKYGC